MNEFKKSLRYFSAMATLLCALSTHAEIAEPQIDEIIESTSFNVSWKSGADEYWVRIRDADSSAKLYDSGRLASTLNTHVVTIPAGTSRIAISFYEKKKGIWLKSVQQHSVLISSGPEPVNVISISSYSDTSAEIFWDRSTGGTFVVAYEIIINGEMVRTVDALSYYSNTWEPGRVNEIIITSIGIDGSRSAPSVFNVLIGDLPAVPPVPPAQEIPLAPIFLRVAVYSDTAAEILWDRSDGNLFVVGYEIQVDGKVIDTVDALSHYRNDWEPGKSYQVSITALSAEGARSRPASTTFVAGEQNALAEINRDNYVSLLRIAVNAMFRILDTRNSLPSNVPEGTYVDNIDAMQLVEYRETVDCVDGGTVTLSGIEAGNFSRTDRQFNSCIKAIATVNGYHRHASDFGGREQSSDFNIVFENVETMFGEGTIRARGEYEFGGESGGMYSYDLEYYREESADSLYMLRGAHNVVYSYSPDPDESYETRTSVLTLRIEDQSGNTQSGVDISAEKFRITGQSANPTEGTITLTASDGSRLIVSPSDTMGLINTTLRDRTGDETTDLLNWSDVYTTGP